MLHLKTKNCLLISNESEKIIETKCFKQFIIIFNSWNDPQSLVE